MFNRTKNKDEKPNLSVVQALHPNEKKQITCLGQRLEDVVYEYCRQENNSGRIVTTAEIVGTIDMLKDRIKGK